MGRFGLCLRLVLGSVPAVAMIHRIVVLSFLEQVLTVIFPNGTAFS